MHWDAILSGMVVRENQYVCAIMYQELMQIWTHELHYDAAIIVHHIVMYGISPAMTVLICNELIWCTTMRYEPMGTDMN